MKRKLWVTVIYFVYFYFYFFWWYTDAFVAFPHICSFSISWDFIWINGSNNPLKDVDHVESRVLTRKTQLDGIISLILSVKCKGIIYWKSTADLLRNNSWGSKFISILPGVGPLCQLFFTEHRHLHIDIMSEKSNKSNIGFVLICNKYLLQSTTFWNWKGQAVSRPQQYEPLLCQTSNI
jgi:hypothetical protein